jgi:hypothetical protein
VEAHTCYSKEGVVSGATYRIDVEHRPDPNSDAGIDWTARIIRLSDADQINAVWGTSAADAVTKARRWVLEQNAKQSSFTLYVNDAGDDELPVKA